jgi:hypothetical protein
VLGEGFGQLECIQGCHARQRLGESNDNFVLAEGGREEGGVALNMTGMAWT